MLSLALLVFLLNGEMKVFPIYNLPDKASCDMIARNIQKLAQSEVKSVVCIRQGLLL